MFHSNYDNWITSEILVNGRGVVMQQIEQQMSDLEFAGYTVLSPAIPMSQQAIHKRASAHQAV